MVQSISQVGVVKAAAPDVCVKTMQGEYLCTQQHCRVSGGSLVLQNGREVFHAHLLSVAEAWCMCVSKQSH